MNPVLRLAGLLPPLDMHHHLRRTDEAPFREGVVVEAPVGHRPVFGQSEGCFVDVGLGEPVYAHGTTEIGQRVTVRMQDERKRTSLAQLARARFRMGIYRTASRFNLESPAGMSL